MLGIFLISFGSAIDLDGCDDSMVAYWQFENNVLDSFGDYDSGYWTEGDAEYGPLKVGNASYFNDGKTITIPNVEPGKFTSSFTTEMWVWSNKDTATLFKKGNYEIKWVDFGLGLVLVNVTIGGVSVNSSALNSSIAHHIGVVWDASPKILRLYIDGTERDSATLSSTADMVSGDITLGGGFTGFIDELAIYDSPLSSAVIKYHYNLGSSGKTYCDSSGAGGSSSTETAINIAGCTFDLADGTSFGVARGECSGFPHFGEFYCSESGEKFVTSELGLGCSMGKDDYVTSENGAYCCPFGQFCNATEGAFKCENRLENCVDQKTQGDCNAINMGCIWIDGVCVANLDGYSCKYYDKGDSCGETDCKDACGMDVWNFGSSGLGTELCGTTFDCIGEPFSIPEENCSCKWYGDEDVPIGSRCQVNLIGIQMLSQGIPSAFECSNDYTLGECLDGEQDVSWISRNNILTGFEGIYNGQVPEECLITIGCASGAGTRFCGEPIIKLPGFSLFSLFASLLLIGMYYKTRKV